LERTKTLTTIGMLAVDQSIMQQQHTEFYMPYYFISSADFEQTWGGATSGRQAGKRSWKLKQVPASQASRKQIWITWYVYSP
jgi:hypothetical protein